MVTEQDLIDLIKKDSPSKDFYKACELKLTKLKNEPQKKILIKIIRLFYLNGSLDLGIHLSQHKNKIIELIYEGFINKFKTLELLKYLKEIDKYGKIFEFLEEAKGLEDFILFDFFKILKEGTNIKEVLNKYFARVTGKELPFSIKINNAEELLDFINKSMCFKDKKYDYLILHHYIKEIDAKNKIEKNIKRKNNNKKSKRINISDTEATSTHNTPIKEETKKTNLKDKNPKNIGITPPIPIKITFNINEPEKKFNIPKEIINYFKERKQYYSKKGYKTNILDELIKANVKIDKNLFVLKKTANDNYFEPHYPNLEKAITAFNDSEIFKENVLKKGNYGYICYKVEKNSIILYKEGIYSILNNKILYSEITDKTKFIKDDFYFSDDNIVDNSYKARALSLEYYLNGFFMVMLNQEELPRVVYNFDPYSFQNVVKGEKDDAQKRAIEMEELDGVFFVEKEAKLDIEKLPFIIDDIVEIKGDKFNFEILENTNILKFDEKTLILLEVKNRFPDDLAKEINILLGKTISFHQLYEERFKNIKNIRVMFFYDAIPKYNYDEELLKIINHFFQDKSEIREKIQFQFIFITSSYLAFNFKNLKDRIDELEKEISFLKEKNSNLEKNVKELFLVAAEIKQKVDDLYQFKINNEKHIKENTDFKRK